MSGLRPCCSCRSKCQTSCQQQRLVPPHAVKLGSPLLPPRYGRAGICLQVHALDGLVPAQSCNLAQRAARQCWQHQFGACGMDSCCHSARLLSQVVQEHRHAALRIKSACISPDATRPACVQVHAASCVPGSACKVRACIQGTIKPVSCRSAGWLSEHHHSEKCSGLLPALRSFCSLACKAFAACQPGC